MHMESLFCGPPYPSGTVNSTHGQLNDSTVGQQGNDTAHLNLDSTVQPEALGCLVNGLNLIPHLGFVLIACVLAVVGRRRHHDNTCLQKRLWVLFPGHSVRWLTLLAVAFVSLCEVGEGVLSDSYTPGHHPHLYVPWITAFLATILAGVFYHMIEKCNRPRLLLILGLYHLLSGGCKLLRLSHLYSRGVSTDSLRFQLTWASVLLYVLLIAVGAYVLYKKRYLSANPVVDPEPDDFADQDMRYSMPYASFPAWCTLWWLDWLLLLGFKQPLQFHHLGRLPKIVQVKEVYNRLNEVYRQEREKSERTGQPLSLWRVYFRALIFCKEFLLAGVLKVLVQIITFVSPLLLKAIITWVAVETMEQQETIPRGPYLVTLSEFLRNGFVLLVLMLVLFTAMAFFEALSLYYGFRVGVLLQEAMQAMIYSKVLRLPTWVLGSEHVTVGEIMNNMSTGPLMLMVFCYLFHNSWGIVSKLTVITVLLYNELGWSAVIALSFMVLVLPVNIVVMGKLHAINLLRMVKTDVRLKWINETIQGIKLLKLNAWEHFFVSKVTEARKEEIMQLSTHAKWKIVSLFTNTATPLMVTLIAFGLYGNFNSEPLTAAGAFSSLTLFLYLNVPFTQVPELVGVFTAAAVITKRLAAFLQCLDVEQMGDEPRFGTEGGRDDEKKRVGLPELTANKMDQRVHTGEHGDPKPATLPAQEDNRLTRDTIVEVRDGSFTWEVDSETANISDINLTVTKGQLIMVAGQIGAGKSSLLSAILGEMRTLKGHVLWNKQHSSVAYAAQRPWLLNASLRDNITFGLPFDHKRYQEVISACCLQPDIDILPAGDLTEIGEKGINLSGGQKQRVSVARAMYAQTDVVLLDDPLSALDAHVGSHLFEQGIMGQLVRDHRTVVLVTHKLQYLEHADMIVAMDKGHIIATGTLHQIQGSNPQLYQNWKEAIAEGEHQMDEGLQQNTGQAPNGRLKENKQESLLQNQLRSRKKTHIAECFVETLQLRLSYHQSSASLASTVDDVWVKREGWREPEPDDFQKNMDGGKGQNGQGLTDERGRLVETEERIEGEVKLKYYFTYAAACGLGLAALVLLLQLSRQSVSMAIDFWLAAWSTSGGAMESGSENSTDTGFNLTLVNITTQPETGYYVSGYAGLSFGAIVLTAAAVAASVLSMLRGARVMHDRMVHNIVRAPMRFFDTTPTGRILNRMSEDQLVLDNNLPFNMEMMMRNLLLVGASFIANAIVTPFFLIGAIPVLIFYYFLQKFFRASTRELQRIWNLRKSPVYSQLSETLGGLSTIRAYRAEQRYTAEMEARLNRSFTPFFYLSAAKVWMGLRIGCIGAVLIFVAGLSSVVAGLQGAVSAAWVGLAMSYVMRMQGTLFYAVDNAATVDINMTSVERIDDYSKVETEDSPNTERGNVAPPANWPTSGEVCLDRVSVRYDQTLDPVLTRVTATIRAGEKVGICGRTGSGKSSLTLALFRMIDVFEGKITIDGIDISCVPLTLLRSRLSIIPQDPVLFSGTIRFNLDPEGGSDDEELWRALEIAQLKSLVMELPSKLDENVSEGGENFSVGQRQLFCLARAFVRKSQILIMDEATASVDMETDATLQEVIKEAFSERTVITVAHRIATILNSDRILVLDQGKVVENDSPDNLLKKPDGLFTSLVKANK